MGACLLFAPAAFGAQYLAAGGFEGGTEDEFGIVDHPEWVEEDNVFGSPICSAACLTGGAGSAGPRTGSHWAWFGGVSGLEQEQSLSQIRTFATEPITAALSFYVWVGAFENETAELIARFDGVRVFTLAQFNQDDFADGYTRVVVPLPDPVTADPHEVRFEYESEASSGEALTNVNVDDVSVETTYLRDGSFEAAFAPNPAETTYYDSPGWTESGDTSFKSPICEVSACGSGPPGDIREPHGGLKWFYFGFPVNASVSQVAKTPALGEAALSFHLVTVPFVNPGAKLTMKVDGIARFTIDPSNDQVFADRYHQVTVPLGPLAAGNHAVEIAYVLPSSPGGPAGANIDDVALTGTIAPPPPAPISSAPPVSTPSPQTRITKLKLVTTKNKKGTPKLGAKLSFAGSGGSGKLHFQCKLDKGKFKTCASPKTYRVLKPGKHSFQVRAVDATGAADATPAKRSFQIAAPKPRGARVG